jgi:hypothetical protein
MTYCGNFEHEQGLKNRLFLNLLNTIAGNGLFLRHRNPDTL